MRGAIAPALLEVVQETTVGEPGETLGCDRRAGHVAAQPFQAFAIPPGDNHVRMQADPLEGCTAGSAELREIIDIDAVAKAQHPLSGSGSGCNAAPHRGTSQLCEERALIAEWVRVGRLWVEEATALEQEANG